MAFVSEAALVARLIMSSILLSTSAACLFRVTLVARLVYVDFVSKEVLVAKPVTVGILFSISVNNQSS